MCRIMVSELSNAISSSSPLKVVSYYSDLEEDLKNTSINIMMDESAPCLIVGTSSISCGIDIQNVTRIFHIGRSESAVSYAQETGRGGRTLNTLCRCTIFTSSTYVHSQLRVLNERTSIDTDGQEEFLRNYILNKDKKCRRGILNSIVEGNSSSCGSYLKSALCDICTTDVQDAVTVTEGIRQTQLQVNHSQPQLEQEQEQGVVSSTTSSCQSLDVIPTQMPQVTISTEDVSQMHHHHSQLVQEAQSVSSSHTTDQSQILNVGLVSQVSTITAISSAGQTSNTILHDSDCISAFLNAVIDMSEYCMYCSCQNQSRVTHSRQECPLKSSRCFSCGQMSHICGLNRHECANRIGGKKTTGVCVKCLLPGFVKTGTQSINVHPNRRFLECTANQRDLVKPILLFISREGSEKYMQWVHGTIATALHKVTTPLERFVILLDFCCFSTASKNNNTVVTDFKERPSMSAVLHFYQNYFQHWI
jgi:hypothetical protein